MWQRIKTAIILVIIVGFALFASSMPIFVVPLLAVGVLIAAHEWTKLMPKWRQPTAVYFGGIGHHHDLDCFALDLGVLVGGLIVDLGACDSLGGAISCQGKMVRQTLGVHGHSDFDRCHHRDVWTVADVTMVADVCVFIGVVC